MLAVLLTRGKSDASTQGTCSAGNFHHVFHQQPSGAGVPWSKYLGCAGEQLIPGLPCPAGEEEQGR